jgi:hypothetical protein
MDGELSGHSGHDDGSTMDDGATVGHWPLIRAMAHSLGGTMGATRVRQPCVEQEAA